MFQGNWTCSTCGKPITELPFEPRSAAGLTCRECHAKKRASAEGNEGQQSERPKFEGNWQCSGCGTAITSLPFAPRDTSNLLCINCYRQKQAG